MLQVNTALSIRSATLTQFIGSMFSISMFSIPSLLLAPSPVLARQWQLAFDRGRIINPAIALVSIFSYLWLSWSFYGGLNQHKAEMYALSAICTFGIWPYTIFSMMPINDKLFKKYDEFKEMNVTSEKAKEVGLAKGETTQELVQAWGNNNIGRVVFPTVGAVLGMWVTLS